jgi:hypothetical protein
MMIINILDGSKPFAFKSFLIKSKLTLNNSPSWDVAGKDPSCSETEKKDN